MGKNVKTISRLELYKRVWETPVTRLAKEYGLSDVGFAKICKKYTIPRPPRGYWAQKAAGKRMTKELQPRRSSDEMIEISPNLSNQFNFTENPKLLKHLEHERNFPSIVVGKAKHGAKWTPTIRWHVAKYQARIQELLEDFEKA